MRVTFHLIPMTGTWPPALSRYPSDPAPRLKLFFPDGADCEELNYGQGEGQFSIDGREWGIYVSSDGVGMNLVCHEGEDVIDMINVAEAVCEKLQRISITKIAYRIMISN